MLKKKMKTLSTTVHENIKCQRYSLIHEAWWEHFQKKKQVKHAKWKIGLDAKEEGNILLADMASDHHQMHCARPTSQSFQDQAWPVIVDQTSKMDIHIKNEAWYTAWFTSTTKLTKQRHKPFPVVINQKGEFNCIIFWRTDQVLSSMDNKS